uniref:imelysin family protein n=1 Tax=Segatella hominis TaxID=2518605 RepID=UPI004028197E
MKKVFKSAVMLMAAFMLPLGFTSCSSDDDPVENNDFTNKAYGQDAMDACEELCNALRAAYSKVNDANLSADQETYLKNVCANAVDNTIQPTYKSLADAVEKLHTALPKSVDTNNLTQENINNACAAFKDARALWEKSEAFLGGAASDFDIDPHIDSWPLNRTLLHSYFATGKFSDAALEDASILGFHALEFILFRDGQPRKVAEFKGNDTYNGFTDVKGSEELKYAEAVIEDLVNHVYELEVAWSENPNATRLAAVKAAGLEYQTDKGLSYAANMKNAGNTSSKFASLKAAVQQLLSMEEGSCWGISNEVGTAKIANPFQNGDISYVESPYSYNSITDF